MKDTLDLPKALDTLNPRILLITLGQYGVRGSIKTLLESYLTNRLQEVRDNHIKY